MTCSEIAEFLGLPDPGPHAGLVSGASIDSRETRPGNLFVCLPGSRVDGHDYARQAELAGAGAILAQRPVPGCVKPVLVAPDTARAMAALAARKRDLARARVVAITGTAGKTTCKDAIAAMLSGMGSVAATRGNHNNHIGLPLTILNAKGDEDFWVLEIGISHEGDMDFLGSIARPDLAVILNAGAGHVEGLGKHGVAWNKARLLRHLAPGGKGIVNGACADLVRESLACGAPLEIVGQPDSSVRARPGARPGEYAISSKAGSYTLATPFFGEYGRENAGILAAVADWAGISPDGLNAAMAKFVSPPGRFRRLETGSHTIIDDTYNANPLSMRAMLDAARQVAGDRPLALVLGEMGELGPEAPMLHRQLGGMAADVRPAAVFWTGGYVDDVRAGLSWPCPFLPFSGGEEFAALWRKHAPSFRNGVMLFKGSRLNHLEDILQIASDLALAREQADAL